MRCKYADPCCPCQDGDICHYEGKNPMLVPDEYARPAIHKLRKALEEIRDVAAISEGVEFYAMLAQKALDGED